ncbi:MAG TPA: class I SAM-dependent methyltransferase [Lysobacter sp.]
MNLPTESILANLTAFYDFRGKHVIHVGAGGGRLIGYAGLAGHVTAIDNDPLAVTALRDRIAERRDRDRFSALAADFRAVAPRGDVVLFEFCLHLMDDPAAQLRHARTLAPEVIVLGHAPDSEWSWYAGEESVVASSWAAVARTSVRRRRCFELPRRFDDYRAVHEKFAALGETSRQRIAQLQSRHELVIAMPYCVVLI